MSDNPHLKIISLQFALFFRDIIDRPDIEFSDINVKMMNIFDAVPSIIPIPRELPPEVPLVTQRSESNDYVCNISRSRIDLHFNRTNEQRSNTELLSDFNAKVLGFINYVLERREISRFGMICRYFYETGEAIKIIREKYFKDSIGEVSELTLRFNRQHAVQDWNLNDIAEISAAVAVMDQGQKRGIFVQRDINNIPDPRKTLKLDSLTTISRSFSKNLSEKSIEELFK